MPALPHWLELGLAITAVLTAVFALLFVVGERLFPTRPVSASDSASGEWKRRREIREYLDAIGERYEEDREVEGWDVAFYLPGRGVAITFDPRAYFRLRAVGTEAVLVEHEMPGVHLGARLPFETPSLDAEDATERSRGEAEEFAVLGLPPSASVEEVQAAYRERVKEVHPDHGGDEETFRRVKEAYDVARERASARAS